MFIVLKEYVENWNMMFTKEGLDDEYAYCTINVEPEGNKFE